VSRPALDTLAAQLSASLSEMSAALRSKLSESPAEPELTESPRLSESARVDSPPSAATPLMESPFRRPSAPVEKTAEPTTPGSSDGLLGAVVAALRRLIGSVSRAKPPVPARPITKRFRTARHRVRKH